MNPTSTPLPQQTRGTGILATVQRFGPAFWAANVMELIERWAYYGVRAVLSLYIVDAAARGGLEFTHVQKGGIYSAWAIVQSLLPMFTGGYSDRYGYKKTVAIAIVIKIVGYLLMGTQHSYWGFFAGCMLLATGTAIFKPGVQGIIANSNMGRHAAVGWGLFYEVVNIGGFVGPWAAGFLRTMSWSYIFYANALLVALNFGILFLFKEPERPASSESGTSGRTGMAEFFHVFAESVKNLFQPRLISFLVIFSGFWMMFNQLFDQLPNFIDDWVNTSGLLAFAGRIAGQPAWIEAARQGGQVQPEWMINIDAGAIVLLMIPVAALFSRLKPLWSIILGILVSIVGILMSGLTTGGALCAAGIFIFAVGEMMASPKTMEYLSSQAPADKRGQYMGYANVSNAIGWGIGSAIGGDWYQRFSDKTTLARQYMADHHLMSRSAADALPREKVLETLASALHQSPSEVTTMLFQLNHPERIWWWFAAIGATSLVGLVIYDQVLRRFGREARGA